MFINTHTYYSLRYGTIGPKELLEYFQKIGVTQFALTDINNTSACMNILRLAPKYNLQPTIGIDFRNGAQQQFIIYAENNRGFQNSNAYLSRFLHTKSKIPEIAETLPDTFVVYPFKTSQKRQLKDNEFLGVRAEELNKLKFSPWRHHLEKLVALHSVSFQDKKGFNTHRLLRAIANNTLLSKLPVSEQGNESDVMTPEETAKAKFSEFPELLANAETLLQRCHVHFDFSKERCQDG